MFLSAIRPTARIAATRVAPKIVGSQVGAVRTFALGDELKGKESFEERKYMQEQEKKFFEKQKELKAAAASEQEMTVFEEVVAPAMVEIQELLKTTKDTVSHEGLELLAKWKLGMKK